MVSDCPYLPAMNWGSQIELHVADPRPVGGRQSAYENQGPPSNTPRATTSPAVIPGRPRATGSDASTATALLETGDSCLFTPAASIRSVEEAIRGSHLGASVPLQRLGLTSRSASVTPPLNAFELRQPHTDWKSDGSL